MTIGNLFISPIHIGLAIAALAILVFSLWFFLRRPSHDQLSRRDPEPLLKAGNRSGIQASPEGLQGGLKHMPLPDLLQFLAQGRRTGTLDIASGRRTGLVRLVQGMIVHAEFRRHQDLDALFGMLALETGDFAFTPTPPPTYPVSGREVVDVLMLWLSRKESAR